MEQDTFGNLIMDKKNFEHQLKLLQQNIIEEGLMENNKQEEQ